MEANSAKRRVGDNNNRNLNVDIDNILRELSNKTFLVEELLQERLKNRASKGISNIKSQLFSSPGSVTHEEVLVASLNAKKAISDQIKLTEQLGFLSNENKALRKKLFLNGLKLPEESKKALSIPVSQSRKLASRESQFEGTLFSGSSTPLRAKSAMRTYSRPGTNERRLEVKCATTEISLPELSRGRSVKFFDGLPEMNSIKSVRPKTAGI